MSVDARFDTDYGDFFGAVHSDASYVHVHEDHLCFDLTVDRLDGGEYVERWQGQISLK